MLQDSKSDISPRNVTFKLGKTGYKIRVANASKGKGKSGGARLITYVKVLKEKVFLIDIYDKSEQATISDKELELLIELLTDE